MRTMACDLCGAWMLAFVSSEVMSPECAGERELQFPDGVDVALIQYDCADMGVPESTRVLKVDWLYYRSVVCHGTRNGHLRSSWYGS